MPLRRCFKFKNYFEFCVHTPDFGSADYVRICSDVEGTKAIECDGGIIRVDEATAAYIPNVNCDSNTPGLPGNPSYECRTERETVYHK